MNLEIKEIELQAERIRSVLKLDCKMLERASLRVRQDMLEYGVRQVALELETAVYGKSHVEEHLIRFPSDWLEAVKERFAPAWLRDRFPVRYTQISTSLHELYPDFQPSVYGQQPVVKVYVQNQQEMPIW